MTTGKDSAVSLVRHELEVTPPETAARGQATGASHDSTRVDEGSGNGITRRQGGRLVRRTLPILPGIVALALWQLLSGTIIPSLYISTPWNVADRLYQLFSSGTILGDLGTTGEEFIFGYAIGSVVGALVGYMLGRSATAARALEPYIMALYGVPMITLAPLFIIWFGIGIWSKVTICAIMVYFVVFFNVYSGVRNVDPELVNVARILGAKGNSLTRHVYLYATIPFLFLGLQAALPFGVIGVIVGEFISAFSGLGLYMDEASTTFDPAGVFAGIVILVLFILLAKAGLGVLERRALRWNKAATSRLERDR